LALALLSAPLSAQSDSVTPPRDSGGIVIDSSVFHDLPITTARQAFNLEPGVIETGAAEGVSLRGSAPGAVEYYVDGAPTRNGQHGGQDLIVGTNAIRRALLQAGPLDARSAGATGGAISYLTRTAAAQWHGALEYRSDAVGSLWDNVGLNRIAASVGGPMFGSLGLTSSLVLSGQPSLETEKDRDAQAPVYTTAGSDTMVHQPRTVGDPLTDTMVIAVPKFARSMGSCDAAANAGVSCQGIRVPNTVQSYYAWQNRLGAGYGNGSSVSVTGLLSQFQGRDFPGSNLYNPTNYTATTMQSVAAILNWTHALVQGRDRSVSISSNFSYQRDETASGPLTAQSEQDSRSPFGGFAIGRLSHVVDFNTTHHVQIADSSYSNVHYLDPAQLRCLQAGEGYCEDNVAAPNDNSLMSVQPYRMNPYAVEESNRFPLWTSGQDEALDLSRESRWQGRAAIDWASRQNVASAGLEARFFDTARYDNPSGMNSGFSLNSYQEKPVVGGAFFQDRLTAGEVTLHAGIRYDWFNSKARYPAVPGRISTMPRLPSDSICSSNPTTCVVGTDLTQPFDPHDPEARFVAATTHHAWSPRVGVTWTAGRQTWLRAGYAQQVQVPDFDVLFANVNTDLSMTNRQTVFGRDLDFEKTSILEIGGAHEIGATLIDAAVFDKQQPSQITARVVEYPDPGVPIGPNLYDVTNFVVYSEHDAGEILGFDAHLETRLTSQSRVRLAYTYQHPHQESYLPHHAAALTVILNAPASAHLIANTSAFLTFAATSGALYDPVSPVGAGFTLTNPCQFCVLSSATPASLPWTKSLDLRLRHAFSFGNVGGFLFAESTNLFNFTNTKNVFVETGNVTYPAYEQRFIGEQVGLLAGEAQNAGIFRPDSSVDFRMLGGCANWQGRNSGGFSSGPVDCVLIERAEQRFGNGDGIFTPSEYRAAFGAWYNLVNAPALFYGPGRRIRLGAEIVF